MLRTTLAGLVAHRLRLLLTSLAITLGVGFIAGTFVLTDTIEQGFRQLFTADAAKIAVAVTPKDKELTDAVLKKIRTLPGVADAQGLVQGSAPLLDKSGRAAGSVATSGIAIVSGSLDRTNYVSGKGPGKRERGGARREHRQDPAVRGRRHHHRSRRRREAAAVHRGRHHRRGRRPEPGLHRRGRVRLGDGAGDDRGRGLPGDRRGRRARRDPETLKKTTSEAVEAAYTTRTGDELAQKLALDSNLQLDYLVLVLLLFGFVAMFVAALVIYNTFNILVAQRTREMALLRCIGATRGQVFRSILLESAVVGLISSRWDWSPGSGSGRWPSTCWPPSTPRSRPTRASR